MPHLHVFTSTDLPEGYAHQVRSFVRIHWDDAYAQDVQAPWCRRTATPSMS